MLNPLLNPVLEDADKFPPILAVGLAIEEAVESPETSFEDIARIVEREEELSQRLLALANSSFYDYPIPVANVPEALSVIGLRNIRNLSIALMLPKTLGNSEAFPVPTEAFWRHGVAVGLCARLMALEGREANTERLFLAGFLHKIGRPLIAELFPSEASEIYRQTKRKQKHYQELAQAKLGFDESEVGAAALHHWRFPDNITSLVQHHHKPVLARSDASGVSFVHIASFIVSVLGIGDSGDRYVPEFSEAAWGYAGFDETKLATLVAELLRELDNVCHVFLDPL